MIDVNLKIQCSKQNAQGYKRAKQKAQGYKSAKQIARNTKCNTKRTRIQNCANSQGAKSYISLNRHFRLTQRPDK